MRSDSVMDDDLLWRIEWIGGVGYNTSVPSEPQIDISLAQLPKGERNSLSARAPLKSRRERSAPPSNCTAGQQFERSGHRGCVNTQWFSGGALCSRL